MTLPPREDGVPPRQRPAAQLPRLRSGIQLGEASSRLPESLVQLLWVGQEGHHQGVGHGEPTQPLLVVATQRRREHQIQMLEECEDGLVVHHEAACLARSPLVDRALPTVRLLQLVGANAPVVAVLLRRVGAAVSGGTDTVAAAPGHRLQPRWTPGPHLHGIPSWCVVRLYRGAWTHNAVPAWLAEQAIVRGISAVQPKSRWVRVTARAQPDQDRHVGDQLGDPGGVLTMYPLAQHHPGQDSGEWPGTMFSDIQFIQLLDAAVPPAAGDLGGSWIFPEATPVA
jgi:hypothetical protein